MAGGITTKSSKITKWAWQVFAASLLSDSAGCQIMGGSMQQENAQKDLNQETNAMKARFIYPNLKLRVYTTGMRQNKLAKMVGIDEAYLSRIINGVRVPGKQMQQQIAEALGCDADWLFQQATIQSPLEFTREIANAG
jgi:ribosome-binding protein aMBF1 (putative translation factor)